jgi:hypothetical protein
MSMSGRARCIQCGSYQAAPLKMVAGTTVMRITKASIRTPRAREKPRHFVVGSVIAADATTLALSV